MHNDGLMLNFAQAKQGAGQAPRPSRQGINRKRPPAAAVSTLSTDPSPLAAKRIRTRESAQRSRGSNRTDASASTSFIVRSNPTTFISSLFSGAAVADISAEEDAHENRLRLKALPTNAPADTSTFEGMGVDPLLAAHLKGNRMNIGDRPTAVQRAALPALLNGDNSRDALVHAQTGSGKTLIYLLPIVQSLLPLCIETWIDRSVGTLAIILAPTRELARQIYEVAEKLCQLHLSVRERGDQDAGKSRVSGISEDAKLRRTRWLVPGLLSGGSTKNHEKSRLRKGIPILVATPGRLLDHLQNTSSFEVGKCRWLILDEADKLLEMGFRETLEGILKAMDGRRRLAYNVAKNAMQKRLGEKAEIGAENIEDRTGTKWWAQPRKIVLCSATLDENVQTLAGTYLRKPQILREGSDLSPIKASPTATGSKERKADECNDVEQSMNAPTTSLYPRLAAPAQLRQNAVIVPPKLRLVTLVALLRSALVRSNSTADARRAVVFLSCTDSVEFFWNALGGVKMGEAQGEVASLSNDDKQEESNSVSKTCELFPGATVYRLHGSLPQSERIASLKGFSRSTEKSQGGQQDRAILLCTSVAARGLDLPSVGCVIQLDPPTEGGVDEYLHRIGRTARVGKVGESWILLLPHEKAARQRLEGAVRKNKEELGAAERGTPNIQASAANSTVIAEMSADLVLKRGFGGRGDEYKLRATDIQLAFERWVLKRPSAASMARRAFLSHIRAYATHPTEEKDLFHVRFLHLGHLAKSFALREAPDDIKSNVRKEFSVLSASVKSINGRNREHKSDAHHEASAMPALAEVATKRSDHVSDEVANGRNDSGLGQADGLGLAKLIVKVRKSRARDIFQDVSAGRKVGKSDAEARMYAKVRELGRQTKSGGTLAAYGAGEFQIA